MRISDWSSDVCSSYLSHHARDLRDALRRHVGLIEDDAPEMVAVGKYLGLMRQVRAAAVDEVDAGQAVRLGNPLRAQMFLRSAERRVGKEWGSTFRDSGSPMHYNNKNKENMH